MNIPHPKERTPHTITYCGKVRDWKAELRALKLNSPSGNRSPNGRTMSATIANHKKISGRGTTTAMNVATATTYQLAIHQTSLPLTINPHITH